MIKEYVEYRRFVWNLENSILDKKGFSRNIIFLCIGSSNVIGDCFGPCVGSGLKRLLGDNTEVIVKGDLNNDVSYYEIEGVLDNIKIQYEDSFIVVVDSALANIEDVGKIFVQDRGLRYGEALGKRNNIIGNVSIKAVVGKNFNNKFMNFKCLNNVSFEKVKSMADFVARGIVEVVGSI